jgi:hypothetical protein
MCANCYRIWARDNRPPNATCAQCGRSYFRRSGGRAGGQTCSRDCFVKWKRGRDARNQATTGAELVVRSCEWCGGSFEAERRHVDAGNARFCSTACSGERREAPRGAHRCEHCGASFERPARRGLFAANRFCSKTCHLEFLAHHVLEREPTRGRAYRRLRDEVIRAEGACRRCGRRDNLVVHHVIRSRERPDLLEDRENLEVLCVACHARHHSERGHTSHRELPA